MGVVHKGVAFIKASIADDLENLDALTPQRREQFLSSLTTLEHFTKTRQGRLKRCRWRNY
jgi:hypothetical protein